VRFRAPLHRWRISGSSIICERDKIEEIIDARTSDAIALALRFSAPIFTYKKS
jgi:bifunctional DNase/RNase